LHLLAANMRVVAVVLLALGIAAQEEEAAMLQLEEHYGEELEKSYKKGAPRRYRKASHRKKAPQQNRKASYGKDAPKRYRKAAYSHKVSYTKEAPTQQYRQVSYTKEAPTQQYRQVSYMKDDHRSYMKDDHRSYMKDDNRSYMKDDRAKCSTISMSADFCGDGKVYDIGNSTAHCLGEACYNCVPADVAACCKVGTRAKCSTIAMPADFCGASKVYDCGKSMADCLGEACDKGAPADVTACCKMLPPCATWLVDFVLVLDASGSMKKPKNPGMGSFDGLKDFAKELVSQYPLHFPPVPPATLGLEAARFSVVSFASMATRHVVWSTDLVAIKAAINQMTIDSNKGTSISDGFKEAGLLFADARKGATKVVLLITDGEQQLNMGGVQTAIAAAVAVKEQDVTVFAWGFTQDIPTPALLMSLEMFATNPCKAVLLNNVAELEGQLEGLQADLCHAPTK